MIVVDVETSGLDPVRCGVISIGAVNFNDPNQTFYAEGRPSNVEITDGALRVNGYTREELTSLPTPMLEVMHSFFTWVAQQTGGGLKAVMAGHNTAFDSYFLKYEMDRLGMAAKGWPFSHRVFDLHTLALTSYALRKGFVYPKDMDVDFIYNKLGMPGEPNPHFALNGAVWEAEAISRLLFGIPLFEEFMNVPIKDNPWE